MLENKEQEKIAGIISDFFDGVVAEADIDILAMKIYEKYVAKLEQDLEFTTKTANELIEIKHKLKQELAELKEKDNYHLRYELAGADETITNLKKQLAEKDIRIEELEGQFAYECECNMQLVDLQKQLEEKQKTIDEINKEFVQAVHDWKTLCAEKDKEISKLQASCQVKMQLKDKTKMMSNEEHCYQQKVVSWLDICNQINNQIKELKGE